MLEPINFFVPGNPEALKRHRTSTNRRTGAQFNYDPSAKAKEDFYWKCKMNQPPEPFDCPVFVKMVHVHQRPKSHYKTGKNSNTLKDNAPFWKSSRPDRDNLEKFVNDALNGWFWKDDCIICHGPIIKVYGNRPGIYITIRELNIADQLELIHDYDLM